MGITSKQHQAADVRHLAERVAVMHGTMRDHDWNRFGEAAAAFALSFLTSDEFARTLADFGEEVIQDTELSIGELISEYDEDPDVPDPRDTLYGMEQLINGRYLLEMVAKGFCDESPPPMWIAARIAQRAADMIDDWKHGHLGRAALRLLGHGLRYELAEDLIDRVSWMAWEEPEDDG